MIEYLIRFRVQSISNGNNFFAWVHMANSCPSQKSFLYHLQHEVLPDIAQSEHSAALAPWILYLPYYIYQNYLSWSTKLRAPWEQGPYFHWPLHPYSLRGPSWHSIHVSWQNKPSFTSSHWSLNLKKVLNRMCNCLITIL